MHNDNTKDLKRHLILLIPKFKKPNTTGLVVRGFVEVVNICLPLQCP